MSCALQHYTNMSLDSFVIPPTCTIRPQLDNETRVCKQEAGTNRYFLRDDAGNEREVLPASEDPGAWAQLTIGLGSGSVGRVAAAFSKNKLFINMFIIYDIIHRMVRDTKLAMEACPGVHRAVLHYSFVMSLNYRPFNSGVWHEEKKGC